MTSFKPTQHVDRRQKIIKKNEIKKEESGERQVIEGKEWHVTLVDWMRALDRSIGR